MKAFIKLPLYLEVEFQGDRQKAFDIMASSCSPQIVEIIKQNLNISPKLDYNIDTRIEKVSVLSEKDYREILSNANK